MTPTSVSVLGLGSMGSALAEAFLRAGHPTTVWNRTPQRCTPLVARGARVAADVVAAVEASPLIVLCVVHNAAVSEVLSAMPAALARRTVVNLSNGTPAQARDLAKRFTARGAGYLDGGILAVPEMIGAPDASTLYSGDPDGFAEHADALAALGPARHLGADPGLAALHDLALLSAMYGMFGGALHGWGLVRTEGVTAGAFLQLLQPWLTAMLPSLAKTARDIDTGDYATGVASPLAMQAAAFDNFLDAAREQGIRSDLLHPMRSLIDEAVAAGHGQHDIGAVVEMLPLDR